MFEGMSSEGGKKEITSISKINSDKNDNHLIDAALPIISDEVNRNIEVRDGNLDIQDIFKELNRLQNTDSLSDDQSIEEILSEAEKLVQQAQKEFFIGKDKKDSNRGNIRKPKVARTPDVEENVVKEVSKSSDKMPEENVRESFRKQDIKNAEKISDTLSPSKGSNIFDMKKTLHQKSGSFSKECTPRNLDHADDAKDTKITATLMEELKDADERLKSLQLQYDNLIESGKQAKVGNESLTKAKLSLEAKIIERDVFLDKMRKELETLKSFKNQFDASEEKLKQEVARLKEENVSLSGQVTKDKVTIQDLQRQCKEMEGILARRHPDSVSALIVASKNPPADLSAKELLEKRISFLEKELKDQETKYKSILSSVQDKVNGMKENYETHISDLEKQVVTLQHIISENKQPVNVKEVCEVSMQTENVVSPPVQTQVVKPSVKTNAKQPVSSTAAVVPTNAQARSESHLLATIRGLNTTLSQKEKVIMKMTRDLDESKRLLSKLQKDKELNLKPHSVEKISSRRLVASRPASARSRISQENVMKIATCNKENEIKQEALNSALKKDLVAVQGDYEKLKKKRIEDLYALQSAHERELMNLNVKVLPLQEDIEKLNATVDVLKNQTKDMDDQMSLLVMERDQYKNKVEVLSARLNSYTDVGSDRSLSSSRRNSDRDYNYLKMKVSELEKRYEGRELRLKSLIDSLAKLKNSQGMTPRSNNATGTDNVNLPGSYLPF